MTSIRRLTAAALIGLLVLAAAGLASGRVAHVTTSGSSMEPTYSAGDLVLVARSASYQVGDIAAFRIPGNETRVLHRIIGGDETGFTLKGDNNESIDPYEPTTDELVGRAIVHIPRVGGLLASPVARGAALLLVLAVIGVMIMCPKRNASPEPETAGHGRAVRNLWKGLLAVDVLLLLAVGFVFLTSQSDDTSAGATGAEPTQTAELSYGARVDRSDTYPTGTVATGDPVFTRLVDRVEVGFRYGTEAVTGTIAGDVRIEVELSSPSGWTSTRTLVPETRIEAGELELEADLVLRDIASLSERVEDATGVPAATIAVVIRASGEAAVDDGEAVPFAVELPLSLSSLALTMSGEVSESADGPAVIASVPFAEIGGTSERDGGRDGWRTPLLAGLLLAVAGTVVLWPTTDSDEAPLVSLGDAGDVEVGLGVSRVRVGDRAALLAIATAAGRPVMDAGDWNGVLTGDVLFWHRPAPPAETAQASCPASSVPDPFAPCPVDVSA